MDFWERATTHGQGGTQPLDLVFFELALRLYAEEIVPPSVFEMGELALDNPQLQQLTALLALLPVGADARATWCSRILATFNGARRGLTELDTVEKVRVVLGVDPP